MTIEAQGPRQCARLPRRMSYGAEILHLLNQRQRIDARLDELVALIDPESEHVPASTILPKSKLRLVASRPGAALFKGGPSA